MAKKKPDGEPLSSGSSGSAGGMLRAPAEALYAEELEHLIKED